MLTLGKKTTYKRHYDTSLLFAISRSEKRKEIGITPKTLPFNGHDLWNCYELTWLNIEGKPEVVRAELIIPCDSPYLIESKSLKLYLVSFGNSKFQSEHEVEALIKTDLEKKLCSKIEIRLFHPKAAVTNTSALSKAKRLDGLKIQCDTYLPNKDFLSTEQKLTKESLCSDLLKTNCPVTGQPDYANLFIQYEGKKINHAGLLRYIVSYRNQTEFHEQCVERMFVDIKERCSPKKLTVFAQYTRRGGIDINPFRTNSKKTENTHH